MAAAVSILRSCAERGGRGGTVPGSGRDFDDATTFGKNTLPSIPDDSQGSTLSLKVLCLATVNVSSLPLAIDSIFSGRDAQRTVAGLSDHPEQACSPHNASPAPQAYHRARSGTQTVLHHFETAYVAPMAFRCVSRVVGRAIVAMYVPYCTRGETRCLAV